LFIVTSLAIMISRQTTFKLTTQDMLIFLIMMAAVFLIDTEYVVRTLKKQVGCGKNQLLYRQNICRHIENKQYRTIDPHTNKVI
jgi:hypothetical protein